MNLERLGPFDSVLDVGGNVGELAEQARGWWPAARITSFEPVPQLAAVNRRRAHGRWWVEECACSSGDGRATIRYCVNQHSASTLQQPGTARRSRFGIVDRFEELQVRTRRLDGFTGLTAGRCLLKIDVEGHEFDVLEGAQRLLDEVAVVVCEVNQDPDVFVGSAPPAAVDAELRRHHLFFAGVCGVQLDPSGAVVQFDGIWTR